MSHLQYAEPPIIEAILDIRVTPRSGSSAVEIATGLEELKSHYPNRVELPAGMDFPFAPDISLPFLPMSAVLGGFRYDSADGRRILQARREGFVFSFVGTSEERYPGWEPFVAEARRLWEQYCHAWRPEQITRVALRYVNQFSFEANGELVADYLTMLPRFPRREFLTDVGISDYAFRILFPADDKGAGAVLNHALVTFPEPKTVLDIDVFFEGQNFAPENADNLWEQFKHLRERKNAIFQACITQTVADSLKPKP